MNDLLTERELNENIMELKDNIDEYGEYNQYKLVFFNAYCFYDHIIQIPPVSELLDALEPYIPLSLNPAALELFIHSVQPETFTDECADVFLLKARVDFIHSLQKANTPERWSHLVGVCGAIRDVKEQLLLLR
jgi:hypothetical protein